MKEVIGLMILILGAVEVSSTPVISLGIEDVRHNCIKKSCPEPAHIFNSTTCQCQCREPYPKCKYGREIFDEALCECACPIDKVQNSCFYEHAQFIQSKCDCIPYNKIIKRNVNPGPPPPPMPPPPPPSNCTVVCNSTLQQLNTTTCTCECTQFLVRCPTPRPRTQKTPRTPTTRRGGRRRTSRSHSRSDTAKGNSRSRTRSDTKNISGCRELTPGGRRYKNVKTPRKPKGNRKSNSSRSRSRSRTKTETPSVIPTDRVQVDSCPDGQIPNINTCECSIPSGP